MLNLFKLKENNKIKKSNLLTDKQEKTIKHFPCSTREWNNSIYVYNKNTLNLTPSTAVLATNLIKSYFNLYNKRLERKMRSKRLLLRRRRLSCNRIYISNGGFKHTNNKVSINLFVFNRQKTNNLLKLKNWYLNTFLVKENHNNINVNLVRKLKLINDKGLQALKIINKDKYLLIKALNSVKNNSKYNINTFRDLSKYTYNFYRNSIRKSLKRVAIYFYYKQLLYINKSKLNYTYLQFLKKHLENLYNKNVEFNIINLKRFYLNSDILSESITVKIKRKKARLVKYLNNIKDKIKIQKKQIILNHKSLPKQELSIKRNLFKNRWLQNHVIKKLKYRHITGFRLEAKGRLHRRFTASRSISKLRYNGNLLNIDSSYRSLSSVLLKGNLRSNIQYTKLSSKTRTGTFGIKGWVSGN